MPTWKVFLAASVCWLHCLHIASPEILGISAGEDLTLGQTIRSTSTCGSSGSEDFTSVVDGTGQQCDSAQPSLSHQENFLTDADDPLAPSNRTWWQSSNGVEEVSLTLSLGGFFFVDGVQISFVTSHPSALVLEGSQDFGQSFRPLRYFSFDCEGDFGREEVALRGGVRQDQLICTSDFSDGTEDDNNLVVYNPSSCSECSQGDDFLPRHTLTDLRVRLVKYSNLAARLDDPFQSSYYAVYDVTVPGMCVCDGKLESPVVADSLLSCPCPSPSEQPFNCTLPSSGQLCHTCLPGFYRSTETLDLCVPCGCDSRGSVHGRCDVTSGECACHPGSSGRTCDSCLSGYLGPSLYLSSAPCLKCFCNGFSRGPCEAEEGWYQARVESGFVQQGGVAGFASSGNITYDSNGFIEVAPGGMDSSQQLLMVSFPPSFLGNKRTSFGQSLTINFSLPDFPEASVEGMLELVSLVSVTKPMDKLRTMVAMDTQSNQQQVKIVFSQAARNFSLVSYFSGRGPSKTARDRDIRMALSNIISLRLFVTFPKEVPPSARRIRLHYASLDYATRNSTHLAVTPLVPVNYVENCTCPDTRTGSNCQSCADTFTINPPYGGEFAHCVSCFCNFHSSRCDPVGGACFDCTGNTQGDSCGNCLQGYVRQFPATVLQCDVCDTDYYDLGDGTCVACGCNSEGSLSPECEAVTGQCSCSLGVDGVKCDRCSNDSTGSFPTCEICDECTDQWLLRIGRLKNLTDTAVSIVSRLNISDASTPELDGLFNLSRIVDDALHSNNVVSLFSRTTSLHRLLWSLINETTDLIERTQSVNYRELEVGESTSFLLGNITNLLLTVTNLRAEALRLAAILDEVDLANVSSTVISSLSLVTAARSRTSEAISLVLNNFTAALNEVKGLLSEHDSRSCILAAQERSIDVRQRSIRFSLLSFDIIVRNIGILVCGNQMGGESCDDCGGMGCGFCGSESCSGLVAVASESVNVSTRALERAQEIWEDVQSDLGHLNNVGGVATSLVNDSAGVVADVGVAGREAELLVSRVRRLLEEVGVELNGSRINPDLIGELVNSTLELSLVVNPAEFEMMLFEINTTIEMFFVLMENSTDEKLGRRAREALASAQNSLLAIGQIEGNFTTLSTDYETLRADFSDGVALRSDLETSLSNSTASLDASATVLNNTEPLLDRAKSNLLGISARLASFEERINASMREIEKARSLTANATSYAQQVDSESVLVERQSSQLARDSQQKLNQSEIDLARANDILNRTNRVQQKAQDQLLTLEYLIRTESVLREDQLLVRSNIQRVANEIQRLERELQQDINHNTICMDPSNVSKRRRRRRKRRAL